MWRDRLFRKIVRAESCNIFVYDFLPSQCEPNDDFTKQFISIVRAVFVVKIEFVRFSLKIMPIAFYIKIIKYYFLILKLNK